MGIKLIPGRSNPELGKKISESLDLPITKCEITEFSDGEIKVEILENVRHDDAYVIQSISNPGHKNLVELLIIIDALKRASADRICAVIPYYGYARQDRKPNPRAPITAKLEADLLTVAGATRIITMDLHSGQIQGFFNLPVDNLYAKPLFIIDIRKRFNIDEIALVATDAGAAKIVSSYAKNLKCKYAVCDKNRPEANESEVIHFIGSVEGKQAILIDDLIDTAGTATNAAQAALDNGAIGVHMYATHGVLSGNARTNLENSEFKSVTITDSIDPNSTEFDRWDHERFRVLSSTTLFSKAIRRTHSGESVSSLFD